MTTTHQPQTEPAKGPQDYPIDPKQLDDDAETLLCEEALDTTDAMVILGQLDPLEKLADGRLRWNQRQIDLIVKCQSTLDGYGE